MNYVQVWCTSCALISRFGSLRLLGRKPKEEGFATTRRRVLARGRALRPGDRELGAPLSDAAPARRPECGRHGECSRLRLLFGKEIQIQQLQQLVKLAVKIRCTSVLKRVVGISESFMYFSVF